MTVNLMAYRTGETATLDSEVACVALPDGVSVFLRTKELGTYPNIARVFPSESRLDARGVVLPDAVKRIKAEIDRLKVDALAKGQRRPAHGSRETIAALTNAPAYAGREDAGLNSRYALRLAEFVPGGQVFAEISDRGPMLIKGGNRRALLMPLRV